MSPSQDVGVLIVSHGSPREEANLRFNQMVDRIVARLGAANVLASHFSIARPNIADRVAELAARGVRRVVLMPFFLGAGQHVRFDIPDLLEECRKKYPGLEFDMLPTLEGEPGLEDVLVERLLPIVGECALVAGDGAAIERRSYEIIDRQLESLAIADPKTRHIVRRVVHATADLAFARSLRVHPESLDRGRAALAAGRPIVCDVRMLQAGITKAANETICAIDNEDVISSAREKGTTRAAEAIERLAPQWADGILAVGNAPTALWKLLEIIRAGGPRPALVVGLPVGFVGARESKLAILESDLVYVTNVTQRGGSPVAAAVVNAIATWKEGY